MGHLAPHCQRCLLNPHRFTPSPSYQSAKFSTACQTPSLACVLQASLRGHMQSRSTSTLMTLRNSDLIDYLRQLNIQLISLSAATSQLAMSASVWGAVESQHPDYHFDNRPHTPTTTGGSGTPDLLLHVVPAWMGSLRRPLRQPAASRCIF